MPARLPGLALEPSDRAVRVIFGEAGTFLRATKGDLRLETPNGTLRLRALSDIEFEAHRSLRVHAMARAAFGTAASAELVVRPTAVRIAAAQIAACVRAVTLRTGELRLRGRSLTLFGGRVALRVERLERSCRRVSERLGELSRLVTEGDSLRAGTVRLVAQDCARVDAQGLRLASDESSEIDGRQVLVG